MIGPEPMTRTFRRGIPVVVLRERVSSSEEFPRVRDVRSATNLRAGDMRGGHASGLRGLAKIRSVPPRRDIRPNAAAAVPRRENASRAPALALPNPRVRG